MEHIKSFRKYVETLQQLGEVIDVEKEVDWNLEMSAVCRRAYDLHAPAPLFHEIKNSEKGFRVLGCPVGLSSNKEHPYIRIAMSCNLPIDMDITDIIKEWSKLADVKPIAPNIVTDGPCKQNKRFGTDIDLTKLPIPFIHEGDGGRYINTYGVFIVKTPDGKWVNWAISRAMLDGPQSIASVVIPTQDLGKIYESWQKIGKDMPMALCLGVDPAISMVAGYPLPPGVNEAEIIGGLYGEGVEVVKCETVDLYVPAHSEIVIEGFVSATKRVTEGPMGEYGGYVWKGKPKTAPLFSVTALTYRDDPIMPICVAGVPAEENHTNWGVNIAAAIQGVIVKKFPEVKRCHIPFDSAAHWFLVTVDKNRKNKNDDKLAEEIGKAVFASRGGSYIPKVFVLDDDIELSNTEQVIWAIATRHHPEKRIIVKNQYIFPLVAYLSQEERTNSTSSRVIYNCLVPFHRWEENIKPVEASFRGYREEIQEAVLNNWEAYGF